MGAPAQLAVLKSGCADLDIAALLTFSHRYPAGRAVLPQQTAKAEVSPNRENKPPRNKNPCLEKSGRGWVMSLRLGGLPGGESTLQPLQLFR